MNKYFDFIFENRNGPMVGVQWGYHAGQLEEGLEGADGGGLTSLGRHAQERLIVSDAGGSARGQRSLHGV